METRSLSEIKKEAKIVPFAELSREARRMLRRERLERFADILENYDRSVRLLSRVEYLPPAERDSSRMDGSPLTIAFRDPSLRQQGLAGDTFGDAMRFFDLSSGEAHQLLCDCHYAGVVTSNMVAARVRTVARRMTVSEAWDKVRAFFRF